MTQMKNMDYWKSKAGVDLTKKPVGPRATKNKIREEAPGIIPGFEDPIKIQKLQRKGLIPGSQKFNPKKDQDFGFINYEDPSDPDRG